MELTQATASPQAEQQMFRDLHTLKGDARIVQFGDVALLCQRLEDLLFAARSRRYKVHEDVDLVVTMAVQFIGMLLRKKAGAVNIGIDLEGFMKQVEDVISEWLRRSSEAPGLAVSEGSRLRLSDPAGRFSAPARERLGVAATTVYVEYLRASGSSRDRLHEVWETLADEVHELDSVSIAPLLERQAAAASDLAKELGKTVDVSLDAEGIRVSPDGLEALNTAMLHALRNAVDHGIEVPDEREDHGKGPRGVIRIRGAHCEDGIEFIVVDDGAGVDLERVRTRAVERGLLSADAAARATEAELVELLFRPGFSLRDQAGDISGRGIGLDAVRDAVVAHGGRVAFETLRGVGTTMTVTLPRPHPLVEVNTFAAAGAPLVLAVPASWTVEEAESAEGAIDPHDDLELGALRNGGTEADQGKALLLRAEGRVIAIRACGPVHQRGARRLCSTPRTHLIEILGIDGKEVLLIRPELLSRS